MDLDFSPGSPVVSFLKAGGRSAPLSLSVLPCGRADESADRRAAVGLAAGAQ